MEASATPTSTTSAASGLASTQTVEYGIAAVIIVMIIVGIMLGSAHAEEATIN